MYGSMAIFSVKLKIACTYAALSCICQITSVDDGSGATNHIRLILVEDPPLLTCPSLITSGYSKQEIQWWDEPLSGQNNQSPPPRGWVEVLRQKGIGVRSRRKLSVQHLIKCLKTFKNNQRLTFIVASSEADTMTLNTGWKMTRVTGLRCPLREYFSGGRGIHSLGSRFWVTGPPRVISSLASFSLDSSSITCGRTQHVSTETRSVTWTRLGTSYSKQA